MAPLEANVLSHSHTPTVPRGTSVRADLDTSAQITGFHVEPSSPLAPRLMLVPRGTVATSHPTAANCAVARTRALHPGPQGHRTARRVNYPQTFHVERVARRHQKELATLRQLPAPSTPVQLAGGPATFHVERYEERLRRLCERIRGRSTWNAHLRGHRVEVPPRHGIVSGPYSDGVSVLWRAPKMFHVERCRDHVRGGHGSGLSRMALDCAEGPIIGTGVAPVFHVERLAHAGPRHRAPGSWRSQGTRVRAQIALDRLERALWFHVERSLGPR